MLLEGFQTFSGQNNVIDWGKKAYSSGENGGITGVVFYDTTRAENDPRYGFGETWQPGIPGVTLNLYRADANGQPILPAIQTVQTDSWDDNHSHRLPQPGHDAGPTTIPPTTLTCLENRCYDGLRNFNQVRPGVFDGGYAFSDLTAENTW